MTFKIIDKDSARCCDWICKRMNAQWHGNPAIGLEKDGELVAVVVYTCYNGSSMQPHVCFDGISFLPRNFLRFMFTYPFLQCGCNVLVGTVSTSNEKALRFDLHLGFKPVHTIPGAGKNGDLVILTMRKEDCKWLNLRISK